MSGHMYNWVGYTWNPLAGECPHDCEYCYVKSLTKRYPQLREKYTGELRIDEKVLKQHLPKGKTIFVCSMNDLFAEEVPYEYIIKIIGRTFDYEGDDIFLFQTKNPARIIKEDLLDFMSFPQGSIIATTIESNRNLIKTNAPRPEERYRAMKRLRYLIKIDSLPWKLMVTIEPILKFDSPVLVKWLKDIQPDFVSIGADSKWHHLPEPNEEQVVSLVRRLQDAGLQVLLKKNLKRIAPSLF